MTDMMGVAMEWKSPSGSAIIISRKIPRVGILNRPYLILVDCVDFELRKTT